MKLTNERLQFIADNKIMHEDMIALAKEVLAARRVIEAARSSVTVTAHFETHVHQTTNVNLEDALVAYDAEFFGEG